MFYNDLKCVLSLTIECNQTRKLRKMRKFSQREPTVQANEKYKLTIISPFIVSYHHYFFVCLAGQGFALVN